MPATAEGRARIEDGTVAYTLIVISLVLLAVLGLAGLLLAGQHPGSSNSDDDPDGG